MRITDFEETNWEHISPNTFHSRLWESCLCDGSSLSHTSGVTNGHCRFLKEHPSKLHKIISSRLMFLVQQPKKVTNNNILVTNSPSRVKDKKIQNFETVVFPNTLAYYRSLAKKVVGFGTLIACRCFQKN
jgi:hypothetical protein